MQVYKNHYYQDQTAFQEATPPLTEPPPSEYQVFRLHAPTRGRLEQVRFGLNYLKSNYDLHLTLRSYDEGPYHFQRCGVKSEEGIKGENLWVTQQLPNNRHIDWIFYKNHIKWEYFLEGYGYTNYLFLDIYKGAPDDSFIKSKIEDPEIMWIYDCNHNRSIERSEIIQASDLSDIMSLGNEILDLAEQIEINPETTSQQIYDQVRGPTIEHRLDRLMNQIQLFNVRNHKIFPLIHEIQCQVHGTTDMFKVKKLWDKPSDKE